MLAVVAIALSALASLLDGVDWSDVRDALTRIGWVRLLLAAGITATSYGVLTGYDVIALRVIGRRVAYPRAALASFTSYVFSHNFGFALLTGGTARWRIYQPAGLTIGEVGHVMVLTGLTFWSGVLLLLGIGLGFWSCIPALPRRAGRMRLLTAVVVAGGLGRLLGVLLHGWPDTPMSLALGMELVVTPLLCWWQGRVAYRAANQSA